MFMCVATPSAWPRTWSERSSISSRGTGARDTDAAIAFVAELKKTGRFQQDVY